MAVKLRIFAPVSSSSIPEHIFQIADQQQFESLALKIAKLQFEYVPAYRAFCYSVGRSCEDFKSIIDVPFMPVELFKHHDIIWQEKEPKRIFESSGTTGQTPSRHQVADLELYEKSIQNGFESNFGPLSDWHIFGLLPSYLERENASLVHMVDFMIKASQNEGGFYLDQYEALNQRLEEVERKGGKSLVVGVTFALLAWAQQHPNEMTSATILVTGGMKGRGPELTPMQVQSELSSGFPSAQIGSEYGMTELLSQGYHKGSGGLSTPNWMKIILRSPRDPFEIGIEKGTGLINVIDLANFYSCSFIATQDIGRINQEGIEVLGRVDNAEIRGCNLMI